MFEVFDKEDTSFLNKYENYFMSANEKVQETGHSYLTNMPQYRIDNADFINDLMSNYDDIYPGWVRVTKFSYVFRFLPDKATMLPHIDIDEESCKSLQGVAKRVLIYANPVWKPEWKGGTYFAPIEQYGVNRHYVARCKKDKFEQEATLVNNVPGRVVVFDPSEIHMPQEFSGNTVQRLVFAALIVHPDHTHLLDYFEGPTNDNGNAVTKLVLPNT
jgi:hypothetical protein